MSSGARQCHGGTSWCAVPLCEHAKTHFVDRLSPIVGLVFQKPGTDHLVAARRRFRDCIRTRTDWMEFVEIETGNPKRPVRASWYRASEEKTDRRAFLGGTAKGRHASRYVTNRGILILDEPFFRILMKQVRRFLFAYLSSLNEEQKTTILVVEHRMDRVSSIARRMIVFKEGRTVYDGSGSEFFHTHRFPAIESRQLADGNCLCEPAPEGAAAVISLRDVTYSYPGASRPALCDVNLDFYLMKLRFSRARTGPERVPRTSGI